MTPWLALWVLGFLLLSAPALWAALDGDADEQRHPVAIFFFALWPLWLALGLLAWALLTVMDWYYAPEDRR